MAFVSGVSAAPTCLPENLPETTPATDFTINPDGTVLHKTTGLIWMRCALGQTWTGATCAGAPVSHDWQAALIAAADFNAADGHAGFKDWRLPNIKELDSLVELQCVRPSLNAGVFPATPDCRFWTSTPGFRSQKEAGLYVNFMHGYTDDQRAEDAYHVRLVRGGQGLDAFDGKR